MEKYTVKQLSTLAGVSVRTLHHYDQIDLLKPSFRSEKGYRFYKRNELFKLQQILFYKELEFPLSKIKEIVNNPSFDLVEALKFHRQEMENRLSDMKELIKTIDKTIMEIRDEKGVLSDEEIYAGFPREEVNSIKKEVVERWGEQELIEVENRIREMGREGWQNAQKKGEEINQLLVGLMTLNPSDIRVQKAISLHFRQLNLYYEVSKERYRGLAKMYVEDERFKSHYENYGVGLAAFIRKGIEIFCNNDLKIKEEKNE